MKIARIILNLEKSKKELNEGNPWENLKKSVYKNLYENNFKSYLSRLNNIIEICEKNKVDLILFPSCSFIYSKNYELRQYLKLINNISFVYTGKLQKINNKFIETASLIFNGTIKTEFDSKDVNIYNIDNCYLISGISSTIKKVKGLKKSNCGLQKNNRCKAYILDLGHHQYNGRYMLTLKSVYKHFCMEYKINPIVLLSFWKYNNGKIKADWIVANRKIKYRRIDVDYNKSGIDFIDIFDI